MGEWCSFIFDFFLRAVIDFGKEMGEVRGLGVNGGGRGWVV